jgi:endonuclease/exonuclease/phosphatase (EEP) superfamily protein YafD
MSMPGMSWLVWAATVPVLVWAAARVTGVEPGMRAVQLLAFTHYAALASLVPVILSGVTRRWVALGAAGLATLTLGLCVLPRWFSDGAGRADGPELRVMTANIMVGSEGRDLLVTLVKRVDPDVLAVQELTPTAERRLDAAGISTVLPHKVTYPYDGVEGSGIYSRHPLTGGALHRLKASGFHQARATFNPPGAAVAVTVESVHPCAPISINGHCWFSDLAEQPAPTVDGPVQILAGDFNATLDHASMRKVLDKGYRDAADTVGAGFMATWPYDERWFVPGVTLDRVLVDRRVEVVRVATYEVGDSDHKAFVADLRLPKGG